MEVVLGCIRGQRKRNLAPRDEYTTEGDANSTLKIIVLFPGETALEMDPESFEDENPVLNLAAESSVDGATKRFICLAIN